jgi:hypothetical protein
MRESMRHLARNAWQFVRGDLQYFAGMNTLFRRFYRAAAAGAAPPIPYAEIRRVTAVMDAIFAACPHEQTVAC